MRWPIVEIQILCLLLSDYNELDDGHYYYVVELVNTIDCGA